ncbi:flagellar export protein FliJ [Salirhabdus salicampi]|uniref:flagellar export protein FliJ n=1 Tax=Salirhabdus salicampi TaxID=476102 RepID=UPI0020C3B115|nr:flagellar export protein FliJ [Salirhabdus salicampi]MCP8616521.1 flagellar export protein FliJ [Salirhabdus salicampi]
MDKIEVLEKLHSVHETEKDTAHKIYQDALEQFEMVATNLYSLLKEKEEWEEKVDNQIQHAIPINELLTYQHYVKQLEEKIAKLQKDVQYARQDMQIKQQSLTDKYVEMKKYELMIENKVSKKKQLEQTAENQQIDEISVQQFIRFNTK